MRTTLDLDEDVLHAVKELALMQRKTAGQLLSELARQAIAPARTYKVRNGVPILPRVPGGKLVTNADVKRWLEEDD